jgi:hypothetical protein
MGIKQDIETIEISIEEARKVIATSDALKRLHKNKDFTTVIEEAYFRDEAARLVACKSNPHFASDEGQAHLDHGIYGLGSLQQFFITTHQKAEQMRRSLEEDEQTHAELLAEDAS